MSQFPADESSTQEDWDVTGRAPSDLTGPNTDAEHVAAVQLALVSMGYSLHGAAGTQVSDDDGVDGVWSAGTAAAVRQFADDTGLQVTDGLDDDVYSEIMQAYGQALTMQSDDGMGQPSGDSLQSHALDNATAIDDLVPGTTEDTPVADLLDDLAPPDLGATHGG
jgi:peptidoglycan hydrolase-like protein with peptidoglycan-binding domain